MSILYQLLLWFFGISISFLALLGVLYTAFCCFFFHKALCPHEEPNYMRLYRPPSNETPSVSEIGTDFQLTSFGMEYHGLKGSRSEISRNLEGELVDFWI